MNGLAGRLPALTRQEPAEAHAQKNPQGTHREEPASTHIRQSRHKPTRHSQHKHIRHSPRLRRGNLDSLDRPVRCCAHPYHTTAHRELSEIPAAERGYDEPSEQIRARFPYESEASANNSPTTPLTSDPPASPRSSRMRMPLTLPRSPEPLAPMLHLPLEDRKHVSVGEVAATIVELHVLDRSLKHVAMLHTG